PGRAKGAAPQAGRSQLDGAIRSPGCRSHRSRRPARGHEAGGDGIVRKPKARNAEGYTRTGKAEARRKPPDGAFRPTAPRRTGRRSVAVPLAAKHAEEYVPGPDLSAVLARHRPRDLVEMREVVDHPRGKQLAQRHGAENRVRAAALEIGFLQIQVAQGREVLPAQPRQLLQQFAAGLARALLGLREAVVAVEGP